MMTSVGSDPSAGLALRMRESSSIDSPTEMIAGARMNTALYGLSRKPGGPSTGSSNDRTCAPKKLRETWTSMPPISVWPPCGANADPPASTRV